MFVEFVKMFLKIQLLLLANIYFVERIFACILILVLQKKLNVQIASGIFLFFSFFWEFFLFFIFSFFFHFFFHSYSHLTIKLDLWQLIWIKQHMNLQLKCPQIQDNPLFLESTLKNGDQVLKLKHYWKNCIS